MSDTHAAYRLQRLFLLDWMVAQVSLALQLSISLQFLLRVLADDASLRSLRVAVARSEVGDGASRLQTVWRRRRACAMRHFLLSKLCEYALLPDHPRNEDVPAGAWQQRASAMKKYQLLLN